MSKESFIKHIKDLSASRENYGSKLTVMLNIQDNLNKKLNADWRNAGYQWRQALMVEAVELFDHLNWKWWKTYKTDPDWDQVNMEAVDIWHFILSELLTVTDDELIDEVLDAFKYSTTDGRSTQADIAFHVQGMVSRSVEAGYAPGMSHWENADSIHDLIASFVWLIESLGLSFDDLYKLYVGKAKLNELRWANGYGSSYIKDWCGMEDNQFLSQVLDSLDVDAADFSENVEARLAAGYEAVKAMAQANSLAEPTQ